jgi:hypothetical protein
VAAAAAAAVVLPPAAHAQLIGQYFQSSVPGFEEQHGVSALGQPRTSGAPPIHLDGLTIRANLDESFNYDSNVESLSGGPGSWAVDTAPSLAINTEGRRGTVGAAFTLDDVRYLQLPSQNHTDWTASLGLNYKLGGNDTLTLGYAHLNETVAQSEFGALHSTAAAPFTSDDFRASYGWQLGRLLLTPRIEYLTVRYGAVPPQTLAIAQPPQDYTVLTAGISARYAVTGGYGLVLAVNDIDTSYTTSPGVPDASSQDVSLLGGIDYHPGGIWLYEVLAGLERQSFAAPGLASTITPVLEANATWAPPGPTTIMAAASRRVEEPTTPGLGSYTLTDIRLVIDHELRHNVVLEGRAGFASAEYAAGGSQTRYTLGVQVTWALNRRLSLQAAYDYTSQSPLSGTTSATSAAAAAGNSYEDNLLTLKLRIAL